MNIFPSSQRLVVAEETKVATRSTQLVFMGRLVRVMASGASALLDRRMDRLHGGEVLVAFFAQFSDIVEGGKRVLSGLLVTGGAVSNRHRPMHKFVLSHPGMTFLSYARECRLRRAPFFRKYSVVGYIRLAQQ